MINLLKNEILDIKYSECCKMAFLSGIVRGIGTLKLNFGGFGLTLTTKNHKLFNKTFNILSSLTDKIEMMKKEKNLSTTYMLKIVDTGDLLEKLEITKDKYQFLDYPQSIIDDECCFKSFLKGLIVANGTLVLPHVIENLTEKDYEDLEQIKDHRVKCYNFEINLNNRELGENIAKKLLELTEIEIKCREKNTKFVLYLKDKEKISDLFAYLSLNKTVIGLQDFIIIRSANNTANRKKNCDMANLEKSFTASMNQIVAIRKLVESGKFDELKEDLKLTAKLRCKYPEITLDELKNYFPKEISKSCINHRLRKLVELSNKLNKEN